MRILSVLCLLAVYGRKVVRGEEAQQECYICRKNSEHYLEDKELSKQFPLQDLPVCGKAPATKKLCPPEYSKGCYTETRGDQVLSKMCSGVEVSDCQEANNVNYCYCKGSLCNKDAAVQVSSTTLNSGTDTDDEDLEGEGGSGDGSLRRIHTTIPPRPSQTTVNDILPGKDKNTSASASLEASLILPIFFTLVGILKWFYSNIQKNI